MLAWPLKFDMIYSDILLENKNTKLYKLSFTSLKISMPTYDGIENFIIKSHFTKKEEICRTHHAYTISTYIHPRSCSTHILRMCLYCNLRLSNVTQTLHSLNMLIVTIRKLMFPMKKIPKSRRNSKLFC